MLIIFQKQCNINHQQHSNDMIRFRLWCYLLLPSNSWNKLFLYEYFTSEDKTASRTTWSAPQAECSFNWNTGSNVRRLFHFLNTMPTIQSEMYVWRSAGYIRKSLFKIFNLWNANRTLCFWVGYSPVSKTMYGNI